MNSTTLRPFAAVACSAALALALVGCGGDDNDDTKSGTSPDTSSASLTAEEFVAQADAICEAATEDEAKAFAAAQSADQSGDAEAANDAILEGVDVIRAEAEGIAKLNAPDELAADVEALLTSLNDGLDKIEAEGVEAVKAGALADASTKAGALGLKECGN